MEPNIEQLRITYQEFSDNKLIRIATKDAFGLRPEAIQVIHPPNCFPASPANQVALVQIDR